MQRIHKGPNDQAACYARPWQVHRTADAFGLWCDRGSQVAMQADLGPVPIGVGRLELHITGLDGRELRMSADADIQGKDRKPNASVLRVLKIAPQLWGVTSFFWRSLPRSCCGW